MTALVQSATQVNVAGSSSTAPSIVINGTVGGNAIVAYASLWDWNTTWTLTDTTDGGNTFTTREGSGTQPADSRSRAVVASAVNITGGDRTVAFNMAGTSGAGNRYYVLGCQEFSGVAPTSPEDTFDVNAEIDITSADVNAGPVTPTDAADLRVGCASINNATDSAIAFGSPTSWNNSYRQNDGVTYIPMDAGYWLPAAIQTTYTPQWSHDNAAFFGAGVVVALKPAAAAAGQVPILCTSRPRAFAPGLTR